ncbi:MAG: hypothetical protein AAF541_06870 [Pseudomonadota bacterium]
MPGRRPISNSEANLSDAWIAKDTANLGEDEIASLSEEYEAFFKTLSEWNDYLESNVPDFEELDL